jgi:hypothetical protein
LPPIKIDASDGTMWVDSCTNNGIKGLCGGVTMFGAISLILQKLSAQVVTGRVAINVMVMPLLLDTSNYSYTINFDGPALQCEDQPSALIQISDYLSYYAYQVK